VRLHVGQPQLGEGQLQYLAARLLGFQASKETFRRILARRRDLVVALEDVTRRRPRRIQSPASSTLGSRPHHRLGLGDLPHLDPRRRRLSRQPLGRFRAHRARERVERDCRPRTSLSTGGAPERLLTDSAPIFSTIEFQACLGGYGVQHVRTKPCHPWTNGRIERVFRTFKETVSRVTWLVSSVGQLDRFVADFHQWHNRDRPHSAWDGRTPDEVFFDRPKRLRAIGRITYFDGRLSWYRFG